VSISTARGSKNGRCQREQLHCVIFSPAGTAARSSIMRASCPTSRTPYVDRVRVRDPRHSWQPDLKYKLHSGMNC
jgi:hypothetical protein